MRTNIVSSNITRDILRVFFIRKMSRPLICQLCCVCVHEIELKEHLRCCLEQTIHDVESVGNRIIFAKYYSIGYMLALVNRWPVEIEDVFEDIIDTNILIYEYFYFKAMQDSKKLEELNNLSFLDEFLQSLLLSIEEPDEQYLRILPLLIPEDFETSEIEDLNIIFSEVQIQQLNQWADHFESLL